MTLIKVKGRGAENLGRRNLVINGAMQVAQRGTSATATGDGVYPSIDRFKWRSYGGAGRASFEQSTDTPNSEFRYSLKATVTTVNSGLDQYDSSIGHIIEGYNRLPLGWGTSSPSSCTISFHVKTSIAGVYSVSMRSGDGGRSQVQETPSLTANTWTKVTLTFVGDTANNWLTSTYPTNGAGIILEFNLGRSNAKNTTTLGSWIAGNKVASDNQVRWIENNGATFFLTGVQLEKGNTASDFEHRSFNEELILCQRYYQKSYVYETAPGTATQHGSWSTGGHQGGTSTGYVEGVINFERLMRATPTLTLYDHNGNSNKCARLATGVARYQNESINTSQLSARGVTMYSTTGTAAGIVQGHYTVSAEL